MNAKKRPREDIFASVCFADSSGGPALPIALNALSAQLGAHFRYWEILVILPEGHPSDSEQQLAQISNVRLMKVRQGTPYYRCRVAAASEAIGDVVVISALEELASFDLAAMIELAAAEGCVVVGKRRKRSALSPLLRGLGRSAGFRVSAEDTLTSAYPRTLLNQLLAHPDRQTALRFTPVERGIPVTAQWGTGSDARRSLRHVGRRFQLMQRLLISSAPLVLNALALLSLLVSAASLAFAIYAVIVWLTIDSIQPGWFTTSLALSLTSAFMGAAIFGLSIGMQKILETLQGDPMNDITGESSTLDLFSQVMEELNVEVDGRAIDNQ